MLPGAWPSVMVAGRATVMRPEQCTGCSVGPSGGGRDLRSASVSGKACGQGVGWKTVHEVRRPAARRLQARCRSKLLPHDKRTHDRGPRGLGLKHGDKLGLGTFRSVGGAAWARFSTSGRMNRAKLAGGSEASFLSS